MALTKLNARSATALDATVLTGNLPAISGASLTGLAGIDCDADAWMRVSPVTDQNSAGVCDFPTSIHMGSNVSEASSNTNIPMTITKFKNIAKFANTPPLL